jgi:thiaminase
MKTFEFTEDQVRMIVECIEHRQGYFRYINEVYEKSVAEDGFPHYIKEDYLNNVERVVCLQTLLNYINS